MKLVESESTLIDYFEEENKLSGEEFEKCLPKIKPNTFDIQKINYLLGNVNICNKDFTNDLFTYYVKNNKDLSIKTKLELLKENYSNYWDLPEDLLFSIAREKLGEKWDFEDIKKRREKWIEKMIKENQENNLENEFEKEINKQKKKESNIKFEKKVLIF